MQDVKTTIILDINSATSRAEVNVKQNDSGRQLLICLNESGRPYFVDEDCRAVVAGTRADNFTFFNEAAIDNGRVIYELTELNTSAVGPAAAELRLYGPDGELIASPSFSINVVASAMGEGEVIESAEATALTALIGEAMEAMDKMADSSIRVATVSLEESGGEPSASVELIPGEKGQTLALALSNLKGEKGDRGDTGKAFTYDMFTPEQLAALTGPQGPVGKGIGEREAMEALVLSDLLPAVTTANGAILTASAENVLLRF